MNRFKFIIALSLLICIIFGCGLCSTSSKLSSSMPDVEYVVSGTARTVSVTLQNADDGTSQFSKEPLPYRYKMKKRGYCYISAQNDGESGTVKVEIWKNGSLVKQSSSSGAYVIATVYD